MLSRFSGGPVSQTDTIELRGFDESEKLVKKKQPPAQKKRTNLFKERAITKNAETQPGGENSEEAAPGKQPVDKGRSTPDGQGNKAERKPPQSPKPDLGAGGDTGSFAKARGEEKGTTGVVEQSSDNLDYFLSGSIPKLLAVSGSLSLEIGGILFTVPSIRCVLLERSGWRRRRNNLGIAFHPILQTREFPETTQRQSIASRRPRHPESPQGHHGAFCFHSRRFQSVFRAHFSSCKHRKSHGGSRGPIQAFQRAHGDDTEEEAAADAHARRRSSKTHG